MEEIKIRHYNSIIRLWLFKATLLLSVFAFSGFNLQAQSAFNQSIKTELVVSSVGSKPTYQLKSACNKYCKIRLATSSLIDNSFNVWALLSYNIASSNKFKQYRKGMLHSYLDSVKLFFKIPPPSSEDKTFFYS